MNIIEPEASLNSINQLLELHFNTTTDEKTMLLALLGGLTALIIIQFVIGWINLWLTIDVRTKVLSFCLANEFSDHRATHLHIAIDHIPPGFDALIKSFEILLFYAVLLLCIFYMSFLMGLAVLFAVPAVLAILLIKGRKEVFVTQDFRSARKELQDNDDQANVKKVISLSNQSFSYPLRDLINSQLTSSLAIVVIMVTFLVYYEHFEYQGIAAMLLVFSIRYSLIYAAELSRFLNRILKQRTIVEKIQNNPFL